MTLNEFLKRTGRTNASFGELIGVSGEAVRRYRHGERFPTPDLMQKIIAATDGDVTANDWFDVPSQADGEAA